MVMTIFFASAFTPKSTNVHEVEADIVDLAIATEFLSTLVAAVQAGDLVDVLKGDGPFTVFAPTNAAFERFLTDNGLTAEALLASPN